MKKIFVTAVMFFVPILVAAQETVVRPMVFPVQGTYSFSNDFGAPRSGGRSHEGIDIMADKMTPIVSATDGFVRFIADPEPSWGYAIFIQDADGYRYNYLHLNNDTPGSDDGEGGTLYAYPPTISRGAAVAKGQLIGWVGDSGNAETTAPHLHFEIESPEGEIINPYFSLVGALASSTPASTYMFTRDLELGDTGADVKELQKYLNLLGYQIATSGPGSPGNETEYFGSATQAALVRFQQYHGISPAVGYFGPLTRDVVNRTSVASIPETSAGLKTGDLVKNLKFAEVFYVDESMRLRWIVNEAAAEKHFGSAWNQNIIVFDDLATTGLKFGETLY